MYRDGASYDKTAELVIQVYLDYGIVSFPADPISLCNKMGIRLIPYSAFSIEDQSLLKRRSLSGFYVPLTKNTKASIFYNDNVLAVGSKGNIKRNIFHEIKHYLCEDTIENPEDDDLADYFGKYFMAPIPFLIAKNICDVYDVISIFGVDYAMALSIVKNVCNRKKKYGNEIFEYERPLLKQLLGETF